MQWIEAEWSTEKAKFEVALREQTERAAKSRRGYNALAAKLEAGEALRDSALRRASEAEAQLCSAGGITCGVRAATS